jgi:hypothetical protein
MKGCQGMNKYIKIIRAYDYNAYLVLHQIEFKDKRIFESYLDGYAAQGIYIYI